MEKLYTIYMHKSPNGKVYIGKTCQYLSARFGKDGRKYKYNKAFFYDISFYGWNAFSHIALEKNLTKDIADERERYFIKYYQANNPDYGYNLQTGGSSDFSQSDATRNKIKLFNKGKKLTDLHKTKIGLSNKGKKHDDEYRKRCRLVALGNTNRLGTKASESTKTKLSESLKNYYKTHTPANQKSLRCIELDKTFHSLTEAAGYFNGNISTICAAIKRGHRAYGKHWEYV